MAVAVQPEKQVIMKKKPSTKRRVVVTGLGVVTSIGDDVDVFYHNLLAGVSGISEIESFDCAEFPTVCFLSLIGSKLLQYMAAMSAFSV